MDSYNIYMRRVTLDEDYEEVYGDIQDLENDFEGLRYESMSGLEIYGTPRPYAETYAESDEADVYIPEEDVRDQTELTLTLVFLAPDGVTDDNEQVAAIDATYHAFVEFISACKVIYWDTVRNRKVKMYLSDSVSPNADEVYGVAYKEVKFKFKNVYGRSFALDDYSVITKEATT